jgi:hypothetical protein
VLYVYALLAARPRGAAGRGLGGEPVRFLRCGGVIVAAGTLPQPPNTSVEAVRAHDAVVRRLTAAADAILPARFGSLVPDRAALARSLAGRAPALRDALRLVAGREQMTLRVSGRRSRASRDADESDGAGPGTRYLAARRRARALPELDPLRRRLAELVTAERVEPFDSASLLATVYHLIPRGRSTDYLKTVAAAGPSLRGVRVRASGPWPPYAFAPEAA